MFKLVIQDDEGKTTVVPLIRDEITIGRKEGNTIRLTERNVSRRHARILRSNGEVQIEDLGSYNGIRVNNARIAERVSLRVSDQVQIGDYKLYLKSEAVEQVDDARTMPIERVDTANTATDVIPAVAAPAPTAPMPVATPTPGTLPPAAQLIGNPNRTLVAVADTDPQNRPVASQAQIAAVLSSPVGYGKLVVLSSNFAGKEFELSRPQMIIGRTDENDIVINHRSISRNHAKLVREPDTGRYTISDLQSSNGVRVNGQDYGKVELRRGDVVDLGHVRLRFVEAGEDFVFARDAVITDVPDTQSKKGLLYAGIVALVVLAAVIIVMVMKGNKEEPDTKGGSNEVVMADAAVQIAEIDAAAVETTIDAAPVAGDTPKDQLKLQCSQAQDSKRWTDLITCANMLQKHDKGEGDKFYKAAHSEMEAEATSRRFAKAIEDGGLKAAKAELDKIGRDSVYRNDADQLYEKSKTAAMDRLVRELKKHADAKDCATYNKALKQAKESLPPDVLNDANKPGCQVATKDPNPTPTPPKDNPCDKYDDNVAKGQDAFSSGRPGEAVSYYEQALKCNKAEPMVLRYVLAASCKAKRLDKAKLYWKRINQAGKDALESLCAGNGIFKKDLEQ